MSNATVRSSHRDELVVLALFGGGLIAILLSIIAGLFLSSRGAALPNWAENVLVATATGALLKMGDVLSALVALASGRTNEALTNKLAASAPVNDNPAPKDAEDAANQMVDAAETKRDQIVG